MSFFFFSTLYNTSCKPKSKEFKKVTDFVLKNFKGNKEFNDFNK